MLTLGVTPSRISYLISSQDGLGVDHAGPRSRLRRGYSNARRARCVWHLSPIGYQYMRAFFRTGLKEGSEPFIVKMVFEEDTLTLHRAVLVPGSFRTTQVTNYSFVIEADLTFEKAQL